MKTAKETHKKLYRKLRVTIKKPGTEEYFNTVSEYRNFSNIWEVPHKRRYSNQHKHSYNPYRKFSVILKQWSIIDKFEF